LTGDPLPLTGDRATGAGHRIVWRCPLGDATLIVTAPTRGTAHHMATMAWEFHRTPGDHGGGCTDPLPDVTTDPWGPARAAIRLELDRRGIRQNAIAVALGLSTKHVSQVLTGTSVGPGTLVRIAAHLGLRFDLVADDAPDGGWLFTADNPAPEEPGDA